MEQEKFDIDKAVEFVMMLYAEGNFSKASWTREILNNFAKAVDEKDSSFYKPYEEEEAE